MSAFKKAITRRGTPQIWTGKMNPNPISLPLTFFFRNPGDGIIWASPISLASIRAVQRELPVPV